MNDQDIRIEEASLSDMDALVGLLKQLFSIEKDFLFNESLQRRGLALMLEKDRSSCILVAKTGQKVVGMVSLQKLVSTAEGGLVGLIEDMVVNNDYHGQGIGKRLLTSIEMWAKAQGLMRLQLLTDKDNKHALGFYEKMNWRATQLICLRKKEL